MAVYREVGESVVPEPSGAYRGGALLPKSPGGREVSAGEVGL